MQGQRERQEEGRLRGLFPPTFFRGHLSVSTQALAMSRPCSHPLFCPPEGSQDIIWVSERVTSQEGRRPLGAGAQRRTHPGLSLSSSSEVQEENEAKEHILAGCTEMAASFIPEQ